MDLLTSGVITEKQAAEQLFLSVRQVQRIKKRFISGGKSIESLFFYRQHPQVNKVPDSICQKVVFLKQQGPHRSCQHISELLPSLLSKEEKRWFTKWRKHHFHLSPQTIKRILEQKGIYESAYEKTTPATRFEMENFGELVQMDTFSFRSLCGYKRVYLVLDDYSRRILAGRFVEEVRKTATRLGQLNNLFNAWINWYNNNWKNRDTGCTPEERKSPSVFKPLPEDINLDDIFCLKDIRRVDKTNSFSYGGTTYSLNHKNNLVYRKVELHIHPDIKIRVFYNREFIEELLYKKQDILSVRGRTF